MTEYYARKTELEDKSTWQKTKDHLENVSQRCGEFANKFGFRPLGKAAGILHDIGKYTTEFTKRLEFGTGRVDHSTAGAILALKTYGAWGKVIAPAVAGHHTGLPNYGSVNSSDNTTLAKRLNKSDLPDCSDYATEITLPSIKGFVYPFTSRRVDAFLLSFLTRMLYSCIVDADSLDAEAFANKEKSKARGFGCRPADMEPLLIKAIAKKSEEAMKKTPNSRINQYRQEIQKMCLQKADGPKGLYSLTVPTGGAKTLASMAFALKHARVHGMDRVIYVIPYTSIIEQNAKVFRDILGVENVLEHHSNYQNPKELKDWNNEDVRLHLAEENWDAPIVVTTDVQFYESLYSNKRSKCRKLHNICNSVVVIDEAQKIQAGLLKPSLSALTELVSNYGCSMVLCTATQPAIEHYVSRDFAPKELVDDPIDLFKKFKRANYVYLGAQSDKSIINRLTEREQGLCIVNTRRHARALYELLKGHTNVFHLSASMCPTHRSATLDKIRKLLDAKKPCYVISTQLIEAGVDIDFPFVFRAIAGIDSLIQAGGRCNREGKAAEDEGIVYIFVPEKGVPKGWMRETAYIAQGVLRDFGEEMSLQAIEVYFTRIYAADGGNLDANKILKTINNGLDGDRIEFEFATIAEKFKMIEDDTVPIVIPMSDVAKEVVEDIRLSGISRENGRKLQPYIVQVRDYQYDALAASGAIEFIGDSVTILADMSRYSSEYGLITD